MAVDTLCVKVKGNQFQSSFNKTNSELLPQILYEPRHEKTCQLLVFFCSSIPVVLFDTQGSPGVGVVSVESSSLLHHSIYP